jgi:hypothetical protein
MRKQRHTIIETYIGENVIGWVIYSSRTRRYVYVSLTHRCHNEYDTGDLDEILIFPMRARQRTKVPWSWNEIRGIHFRHGTFSMEDFMSLLRGV